MAADDTLLLTLAYLLAGLLLARRTYREHRAERYTHEVCLAEARFALILWLPIAAVAGLNAALGAFCEH